MFVMRIVLHDGGVVYFTGFDFYPEDPGKDGAYWAMLGNRIQTFVDEESAGRALETIKTGYFHYLIVDDSEAKIAGADYQPKPFLLGRSWEIQVLDLTDMIVCRRLATRSILK